MKTGIFLLHENFHANHTNAMLGEMDLSVWAEELGFDEVWFAEHHFNDFSVIPSPSLTMAYLAAKTKSIRIGSAAFLAPFYHPVRLAEEIASLDVLSSGRTNAGFAKGGFTLDMELFDKSADQLREEMFEDVQKIAQMLESHQHLQPKPIQKKIPFYIATFSTKETIEYAANHGYGLLFSQGASLEECVAASNLYHTISGVYPEVVVMRVLSIDEDQKEAHQNALIATDHFIKCMQAVKAKKEQPAFAQQNYEELLAQRYDFFHAQNFINAGIIGSKAECIAKTQALKDALPNLHLILKPATFSHEKSKKMLKIFKEEIEPNVT